jgi:hypothetical protein
MVGRKKFTSKWKKEANGESYQSGQYMTSDDVKLRKGQGRWGKSVIVVR